MGLSLVNGFLQGFRVFFTEFILILSLHFLGLVDSVIQLVLNFNHLSLLLVFFSMGFSVFSGFLNFVFAQATTFFNGDALFFAGTFVFSANDKGTGKEQSIT